MTFPFFGYSAASPLHPALEIVIAAVLDALLGDSDKIPHPVALIGRYITWFEKIARVKIQKEGPFKRKRNELAAGKVLGISTVVLTLLFVWGIIFGAQALHPWAASAVRVLLLYFALAGKCLAKEGMSVAAALRSGDIPLARTRIARIVGRDTQKMTGVGIARACTETVAENTTDGIVSPLFYAAIGALFGFAAPLAWAFKAVSTLDSMVGYKNEKYLNFGRYSAKQDDVCNYLPARLTGMLMTIGAWIVKLDWRNAGQTLARDHAKHSSPNSGWSEAAMAGALGVRLGGGAYYFGQWVQKPTIGFERKIVDAEDIRKAINLMWVTEAFALLLCVWSPLSMVAAAAITGFMIERMGTR